jgi:hypothetical protein
MRYTFLAFAAPVALGLLAAGPPAAGQDRRPGLPSEFTGKYLAVMLRSNRDVTHMLEQAEIRKLGDRLFLAGVGMDAGSAPKSYVGLNVWLALHDVSEIQVYATRDALRKAFASPGNEGGAKKKVKP